jgi:protein-S-isoprenylcysteine O-methyltransferase Ste14
MTFSKLKSFLFVIIQFTCIILIVKAGPVINFNILYWIIIGLGASLAAWALWLMKVGTLNIFPEVTKQAQLVTSGPYKFIRHPMYLSVLMLTAVIVANNLSLYKLIIWLVLLIDLNMKLVYEEKLLSKHFKQYHEYMKKSKKLVPYFY